MKLLAIKVNCSRLQMQKNQLATKKPPLPPMPYKMVNSDLSRRLETQTNILMVSHVLLLHHPLAVEEHRRLFLKRFLCLQKKNTLVRTLPCITSLGVLKPRPTSLWYLSGFRLRLTPMPFLRFKNTVGCFWNERSVWNL